MQSVIEEIRLRTPLSESSRRLFHGRGHCFPGYEDLLIDWYNPILLVSLYRSRSDEWLQQLAEKLKTEVPEAVSILLQERYEAGAPLRSLWGKPPSEVDAVESGLRYRLRLGDAQNIGFFLDMAAGRKQVKELAEGRKVLNLFSYTCSFSVAALAGGANQVVNLDMNQGALELGRLNHRLNGLDERRASFLALEVFRSFSRLKKLSPFDLVICDPPAYQGKSFTAERDWPKLLRRLSGLLASGGDLIACLNGPHLAPVFLTGLLEEHCPQLKLQKQLQPGADFPEAEAHRGSWVFHYR